MMTLVMLLGAAVMVLVIAIARHERVQAAADAAAEAAVASALGGEPDPCGVAAEAVAVQELRLVQCNVDGDVFEVVVDEPQASPLLSRPARARAGPVPVDSP